MRKDEFVMRGQTESYNPSTGKGGVETLNFSGFKPGYAYRLIEFQLFPSTSIGTNSSELCATITAGKTALDPTNPDFSNDSLIATYVVDHNSGSNYGPEYLAVINDTFLITQNLILMVQDTGGNLTPVNWQCKFKPVKMAKAEEAVANYKQFMISDGS